MEQYTETLPETLPINGEILKKPMINDNDNYKILTRNYPVTIMSITD